MTQFKKYQHVERLGNTAVEGILDGYALIFPKLDGTNASVWKDKSTGKLRTGSRNRVLSAESDNAGFDKFVQESEELKDFFEVHPNLRLYGEWLVPHSIKGYKDDAWRKFYVFDVTQRVVEEVVESIGDPKAGQRGPTSYVPYGEYFVKLASFNIPFLRPILEGENLSIEAIYEAMEKDRTLLRDDENIHGEGVVIKNYSFRNKFHHINWAKVLHEKFKDTHKKNFGQGSERVPQKEELFVTKNVTREFILKEYNKILNEETGFNSKDIPRLLSTIFYTVINEELWDFIKKNKNPTLNFQLVQKLTYNEVRKALPEVFS